MPMNNSKYRPVLIVMLSLMLGCSAVASCAADAPRFSFAVLADPRWYKETWKNALTEIRDMRANPAALFTRPELIVVVGDMDPIDKRYGDYQEVFARSQQKPPFLPVIGNHDVDEEDLSYISAVIIPAIPGVVRRHPSSCDYYVDYKNVRVIALDAYTELGRNGVIYNTGMKWTEQVINSAPVGIDHIFICFHEPAFPRYRHISMSFDKSPEDRNAFWNMLVRHSDRVRATFVAHDHYHNRMRVKDPSGSAANDALKFPDEAGGIYQVDCGAAGMGSVNTVVLIQVNGKALSFRVIQAENGRGKPFSVKDVWLVGACPSYTPTPAPGAQQRKGAGAQRRIK